MNSVDFDNVIDTFLAEWKEKQSAYYLKRTLSIKYSLALENNMSEEFMKIYATFPASIKLFLINPRTPDVKILDTLTKHTIDAAGHLEDLRKYQDKKKTYVQMMDATLHKLADIPNEGQRKKYLATYLSKEVKRKKENFTKSIIKKGGKILCVKTLVIGINGMLNGVIDCENGTITLETIPAGGHNIQSYHFRTLVKLK